MVLSFTSSSFILLPSLHFPMLVIFNTTAICFLCVHGKFFPFVAQQPSQVSEGVGGGQDE
jgi:hypothetical protein